MDDRVTMNIEALTHAVTVSVLLVVRVPNGLINFFSFQSVAR